MAGGGARDGKVGETSRMNLVPADEVTGQGYQQGRGRRRQQHKMPSMQTCRREEDDEPDAVALNNLATLALAAFTADGA